MYSVHLLKRDAHKLRELDTHLSTFFPPCNRERSLKDNPSGADAQVLRETCFHRQPQTKTAQLFMYIQQTMIQETQRCDQTTWIQKRED